MTAANAPRILVLRHDQLGDLALTAPLLEAIKKQWPQSTLHVIVRAAFTPIIDALPCVDQCLIHPEIKRNAPMKLYHAIKVLKKWRPTMMFFPVFDPIYVLAATIVGCPIRVGDRNQLLYRACFTHGVKISWHDFSQHEADQHLRLLRPFVKRVVAAPPVVLSVNEKARERWIEPGVSYIVVHPGYGKGNRGWHARYYAALCDYVYTTLGKRVILTGTAHDQAVIAEICQHCQSPVINTATHTTLPELLAILQGAACVVGAETGPVHLAALLKRPIVSISPTKYTSSFRWGPYKTPHVILKQPETCALVCHTYRRPCAKNTCIDVLSIDHITRAVSFIVRTPHFPHHDWFYWMKTNGVIALHMTECTHAATTLLQQTISLLESQQVQWRLVTTKKQIKKTLQTQYPSVHYMPAWRLDQWVHYFAVQNITVWHAFESLSGGWLKLIQWGVAWQIDRQPLYIRVQKYIPSIQKLFTLYLAVARRLSK